MPVGPKTERCTNCNHTIGRQEQAYLYENAIICGKCYLQFTSSVNSIGLPKTPADEPSVEFDREAFEEWRRARRVTALMGQWLAPHMRRAWNDIKQVYDTFLRRPRWQRFTAYTATICLSTATIIGIVFFIVSYAMRGTLPNPKAIQRKLKVWALDKRESILRGRPLTEIPFTPDAAKYGENPFFSLYLDDQDQPIAASAHLADFPEANEPGIYDEKDPWVGLAFLLLQMGDPNVTETPNGRAHRRYDIWRSFVRKFLGEVPLGLHEIQSYIRREPDQVKFAGLLKSQDEPYDRHQVFRYTYEGYDVELSVFEFKGFVDANTIRRREWLWIIKGCDW